MAYQAKKFELKNLEGISENQISQHRDILYAGYVTKLNEIEERLKTVDISKANQIFSDLRALKAEESFAMNGVLLHELYFENLNKQPGKPSTTLQEAANKKYGTWDNLITDMKAAAGSTTGWVVLTWNKKAQELQTWILYEHHIGLPIHQEILLALDCWEHAFMIDYGINKADYLKAFFTTADWNIVSERLAQVK